MLRFAVLVVCGLLLAAIGPADAAACSLPNRCPSLRATLPADGATEVPLNTEIEVVYYGSYAPRSATYAGPPDGGAGTLETIRLQIAGGEIVTLVETAHDSRYRPDTALLPDTTYEIVDVGSSSPEADRCGSEPHVAVVIATFHTGTTLDTTPPVVASTSASGCRIDRCDSSACCGPYLIGMRGIVDRHG